MASNGKKKYATREREGWVGKKASKLYLKRRAPVAEHELLICKVREGTSSVLLFNPA